MRVAPGELTLEAIVSKDMAEELSNKPPARECWLLLRQARDAAALSTTLADEWAVSQVLDSVRELERLLREGSPPEMLICGLQFNDGDGFQVVRLLAKLPTRPAIFFLSTQQRGVIKAAMSLARVCGLTVAGSAELPNALPEVAERLSGYALPAERRGLSAEFAELRRNEVVTLIAEQRLEAWVQPKLRLATREIVSFESLMRARDANGGLITPDRLVPALLEHQLLDEATLAMTAQTVRFVAKCLGEGMAVSGSINVSLPSLSNPAFCYSMVRLVEQWHVDPTWITLEITETEAMSDIATVIENAGRIRMLGFNLAIDDFGSGYSSMLQLARIPFSELKIDGSFVHGAGQDRANHAIVHSCAHLGRALQLRVVAEGVETAPQLQLVEEAGCTEAQGYLISKPMPADQAWTWLSTLDGLKIGSL